MASGPLFGGGSGGGTDGSRDKHRWAESKVYTRKSFNKSRPKPSSSSATAAAADSPPPPQPPLQSFATTASDDDSSAAPTVAAAAANNNTSLRPLFQRRKNRVTIRPSSGSRRDVRDLRRRLTEELDRVRSFMRNVDAAASGGGGGGGGYSQSQLSSNFAARPDPPESVEKEKRTSKANQYYQNSEFLLSKDKFPPPETHKKPKSGGKKNRTDAGKATVQTLKNCGVLLSKLMKHKHGWVFNKPVDVKALGLHDYYTIIKHPMDLGTIRSRLSKNWYKSPKEFAEDVRLTFRNAMTYNPKGQDVHAMAEVLSNVFEERWVEIEAEYDNEVGSVVRSGSAPSPQRTLDRSESMTAPLRVYDVPLVGHAPAPKKPKAKDPLKRNMTMEEKTKLSFNLQALPPEKLEAIVQIIKKRNSSVSQHDDEIEVDIDQVDNETLWELDRFITNYKKSLSKNKRKADLAVEARGEADHKSHELNLVPHTVEAPKESKTDENKVPSSSPVRGGKQVNDASRSGSSSSSSSGSGSSSDSDSDSSSGYGSDTGQSPRS
ncbi:Transcription factor GTE4 [Acorus calamus]|uniref:Transcription factor GTE4 n=1 Tax=Acorus calamus TaxID=4465 RepID=A0AAV9FGA0_ACOCL|nr:Transcription factor GTE4 [Acorus calamus]